MSVPDLLERSTETSALLGFVTGTEPSAGGTAVILGEPGIGKTVLMDLVRRTSVDRGIALRSARGTDLAKDTSFAVAGALLRSPNAGPVVEHSGTLATLQGLWDGLLTEAGAAPLIVAVDDCHWVDVPSLRFLAYASAKAGGTAVRLVLTSWPEPGGIRQPIIDEILSSPGTLVLRPKPLSRQAAERLLGDRLVEHPDPAFSAACFTQTAGNPLQLCQLADSVGAARLSPTAANVPEVADMGADVLGHRVQERISQLPRTSVQLLQAIAVLGDGAPSDRLTALAGRPVEPTAAASELDDLIRTDAAGRLEFVHPRIRDVLYQSISPDRRADLHRQAAKLLAQRSERAESVAAQYIYDPSGTRSEADSAGQLVLQRAAQEAIERGSPESALRYLRRALAAPSATGTDRQSMLLPASWAAFQVDLPSAVGLLRETLAGVTGATERLPLAGILVAALLLTGHADDALEFIRGEQRQLQPNGLGLTAAELDLQAYLDSALAMVAMSSSTVTELDDRIRGFLRRAPMPGFGGRSLDGVLSLYQAARCEPEAVERALRAIADGVVIAGDAGRPPVAISVSVLLAADRPEALPHLDQAVTRATDQGSLLAASGAYAYRAYARLLRGDLVGAHQDAVTARWSTAVLGLRNKSFLASVLATTCLQLGDLDKAAEVLAWSEVESAPPDRPFTYFGLTVLATLHRLAGDPAEGLRIARTAGQRHAAAGGCNPAQVAWRVEAALCLQLLGRLPEAVEIAQENLELARRWSAPRAFGQAARTMVTIGAGSVELLTEAIEALRPSIARLELADCLLARGAAIEAAGGDGSTDLSQGRALAIACGVGAGTGAGTP